MNDQDSFHYRVADMKSSIETTNISLEKTQFLKKKKL